MAKKKGLPFAVVRDDPASLTDQIVGGVSRAIRSGKYAAGDKVHTIVEMAESLGVSAIVVRNAMKRLSSMGLVTARPGSGIHVRASLRELPWKAHVITMSRARPSSYFFAVRDARLHECLAENGIRTSSYYLTPEERAGAFPRFKALADIDPPDLAVLEGPSWGALSVLGEMSVPFVHLADGKSYAKAVGSLVVDGAGALVELARHCASYGVRSVLAMFTDAKGFADAVEEALCAAGVDIDLLVAPPAPDLPTPERVELGGMRAISELVASGKHLPDLVYFSDDYLGRGGLMALVHAGVRVPEDVQVVMHANRGHLVAFPREVTRIELDPGEVGERLASVVVAAIEKPGCRKTQSKVEARFVVGETTKKKEEDAP